MRRGFFADCVDRQPSGRRGIGRGGLALPGPLTLAVVAGALGLVSFSEVDVPKYEPTERIELKGGIVKSFAFHPDGKTIAVTDYQGGVMVRQRGGDPDAGRSPQARGSAVAFSNDGRFLLVAGDEPNVVACALGPRGGERSMGIPVEMPHDLRLSPHGSLLAVASPIPSRILVWDLRARRVRRSWRGRDRPITMEFSPDGRSLAVVFLSDPAIHLWDLETGRVRDLVAEPSYIPLSLCFSPDGRTVASTSGVETSVRLWDIPKGQWRGSMASQSQPIRCLTYSPDGNLLAIGGAGGLASLWNTSSGREVRRLDAGSILIQKIAFSPDGRTLAASGHDDHVRIWDLEAPAILPPGPQIACSN